MEIDLGSVVKEYAVDRTAVIRREASARHGFVNLGGDIRIIGPHPDRRPWRIGIHHPRRPGALIQTLSLHAGGLASSGDYERCITVDGVRYGHILVGGEAAYSLHRTRLSESPTTHMHESWDEDEI